MANVLSAWTEGKSVSLIVRGDDGRLSMRRLPAKWTVFVTGLTDEDRYVLGRDKRVRGVSNAGPYTRVDCVSRWGRDDIIAAIERAAASRDMDDVATYEGDVSPVRRVMSDVGSLEVDPAPRRGYFDLEVDSRKSFEQMRNGDAPILSWAVVDSMGELVNSAVLQSEHKKSERELLAYFFESIASLDCMLAWNGDAFDFEVLRNRASVLGVEPPVSWMRWTWLDHMLVFKKYNMHSDDAGVAKVSYALNHVAEYLLGEGKVDFDASRTWEAWAAGGAERARLLEYNEHDVHLMQRVEGKTGYLSLHLAVCHICRVFPDTSSLNATQQGDGFLLRLGDERGYRWPTKQHVEETTRFAGAYVMEPRRLGAIDNVHVADFAGLYPSIMRTFNMGLDTKLTGAVDGACQLPGRDTWFSQGSDGMFRIALDRLVGKRAEYQSAMKQCEPGTADHDHYNRLSKAFKIVANSFYGICGSPYSRFFDVEIAEGVTQTGKWLLQQVIESAASEGFDPFYGDSITGERPVVLRDPRGDVVIRKIEDVWGMFGPAMRAPGGKRTKQPQSGWMALARASDGREGWFPLCRVIRHRVSKDIWKITTKRGQVEVTADHSIMVGGKAVKPKRFASEGMEFDVVRAASGAHRSVIDILEYVGGFDVRVPYKGREIVRRLVADPDDPNWLLLDGWGDPDSRVRRFYKVGSPELDALVRLCAAYASDGSASIRGVTAGRYMLSFCKQDSGLLVELQAYADLICSGVEWFGPYWSDGAGVHVLRSGTATMSVFFAALCGFKSKQKRLPDFVFGLPTDGLMVVWEQLKKGDASTCGKQWKYGSSSPVLAAQVSYLLDLLDCETGLTYRESKNHWTVRTRPNGSARKRRVIGVAKRAAEKEAVYDLEVEGAHTFVDGIGRVLCHNTDSVFVAGDGEAFRAFVSRMNASWAERLRQFGIKGKHYIDLDFEKTFRRLIMVSAKRYAGAFAMYKGKDATDAKPEVKGLEFKRGDTLSIAREFQTEIVLALLESELPSVDRMWEVVARWREHVLRGALAASDVVLSQSLSRPLREYSADYTRGDCARCGKVFDTGRDASGPDKCPCGEERKRRSYPAHVRVALDMAARGQPVQEGGRVSYLLVESNGEAKPVPADTPGAFERIDREYYWQRRVYPPSQRLLEIVYSDVEWAENSHSKKARALEKSGQRSLFDLTVEPVRKRRSRCVRIMFATAAPGRSTDSDDLERARLQAIRAAIEAHPGDVPVMLVYCWRDTAGRELVVRLPVGPMVRADTAARRALERVIGDGEIVGMPKS